MKSAAMICILAAAACASGGANNGSSSVASGVGPHGERSYKVTAPLASTWMYLPVAYSRLGLKITKYDSSSHVIEGERTQSGADFGGTALGMLLNCGTASGASNAALDDATIHVSTTLSGNDTTSNVMNMVHATLGGGAGDSKPCTVNPAISDRVAGAVSQAVAEATK